MRCATTKIINCPATKPVTATMIGSPAATNDPKASSKMMIAISRPIPCDESGPTPAASSTAPAPPTTKVDVPPALTIA